MNVQLLIPVHNINTVHKLILFQKCLFYLDSFDLDRHAFIDKTVTENIIELLVHHRFTIHSNCPLPEWEKVKYAYDLLEGPYIAICHQDDFWLKDKLNHQLRYIQQSPLCMTSFIYSYKDRTMPHQRAMREIAVPAIDSEIGLWNCMPSTWVLNKSKLPTLPIPYNNGSTMCMDQAIAMAISQMGPIEVVRMPFVIYNDLGLNQWHSASKEEHLKARHDLKSFFHSIPRPQLNYHWS